MSTYSRVRARGFGYGWPYQPSTTCGPDAPSPSTIRPPERWSSVIALIAVAVGVRAAIWTMLVPRRIRLVDAPYQASGVNAAEPYASAVHTESKPSSSALSTASSAPGVGPLPQYPTWNPSFTNAS